MRQNTAFDLDGVNESKDMNMIFYVGSNCGEDRAGLRVMKMDATSGAIHQLSQVDDAVDPIYFAQSADGKFLYVAEKMLDEAAVFPGGISVYQVEDKKLNRLASTPCAVTVPCHVGLSADGKFLAWAEYRNATAGVFCVGEDGLLCKASEIIHHEGSGPNAERQEAAHCHYAQTLPNASALAICDLGLDRVVAYQYDEEANQLVKIEAGGYRSAPGAGPRHLAFHPSLPFAFLVTELDSTVVSLRNLGGGRFESIGTYSMLPTGFDGFSKAAAIKVSPDGQWVLASNRGHDSIAAFRLNMESGELTRFAINLLNGEFPRDFEFTPDGTKIVLGHKMSNEVAVYSFDRNSGEMNQIANTIAMPKPLCFVFAK